MFDYISGDFSDQYLAPLAKDIALDQLANMQSSELCQKLFTRAISWPRLRAHELLDVVLGCLKKYNLKSVCDYACTIQCSIIWKKIDRSKVLSLLRHQEAKCLVDNLVENCSDVIESIEYYCSKDSKSLNDEDVVTFYKFMCRTLNFSRYESLLSDCLNRDIKVNTQVLRNLIKRHSYKLGRTQIISLWKRGDLIIEIMFLCRLYNRKLVFKMPLEEHDISLGYELNFMRANKERLSYKVEHRAWILEAIEFSDDEPVEDRCRKRGHALQYHIPDVFELFATSTNEDLKDRITCLLIAKGFKHDPALNEVLIHSQMRYIFSYYQASFEPDGKRGPWFHLVPKMPVSYFAEDRAKLVYVVNEFLYAACHGIPWPEIERQWLDEFLALLRRHYEDPISVFPV